MPDLAQVKECFATDYAADREQKRAEQDLNAQREMAQWAEGMFWASVATAVIAFIGLVFIALTLVEARETTRAAIVGSKHSERHADLAEDAYRRLERPYLFIEIADTKWLSDVPVHGEQPPQIEIRVANHGKTPAILHWLSVGVHYNPTWPKDALLGPLVQRHEVIAAGTAIDGFPPVEVVDWPEPPSMQDPFSGEPTRPGIRGHGCVLLILRATVAYEDTTGAVHRDHFCLRGNPGGKTFRIEPADALNGRETFYPGDPGFPEALIPPTPIT